MNNEIWESNDDCYVNGFALIFLTIKGKNLTLPLGCASPYPVKGTWCENENNYAGCTSDVASYNITLQSGLAYYCSVR